MKNLSLLMIALTIFLSSPGTFAGGKGNGGDSRHLALGLETHDFEKRILQLRDFFWSHSNMLEDKLFAAGLDEIQFAMLKNELANMNTMILVNDEVLTDKNGKELTCMNYSQDISAASPDEIDAGNGSGFLSMRGKKLSVIHCNYSRLKMIEDERVLYALALHEKMGLANIEVSSPSDYSLLTSYKFSHIIADFVGERKTYDLFIDQKSRSSMTQQEKDDLVKRATGIFSKKKGTYFFANYGFAAGITSALSNNNINDDVGFAQVDFTIGAISKNNSGFSFSPGQVNIAPYVGYASRREKGATTGVKVTGMLLLGGIRLTEDFALLVRPLGVDISNGPDGKVVGYAGEIEVQKNTGTKLGALRFILGWKHAKGDQDDQATTSTRASLGLVW